MPMVCLPSRMILRKFRGGDEGCFKGSEPRKIQVLLLLRILRLLRVLWILLRIPRILTGLLSKRTLSRRLTDGLSNRLSPETCSRLHARLTHAKRIF